MATRENRKEPPPAEAPPKGKDVVVAAGPTADQKGAVVLRSREGRVELGELRPLEEGKPLEVLRLRARADSRNVFDVEETIDVRGSKKKSNRPAQVASDRYRANWEAIYGSKDWN
jgi:hypothetical protein